MLNQRALQWLEDDAQLAQFFRERIAAEEAIVGENESRGDFVRSFVRRRPDMARSILPPKCLRLAMKASKG